MRLSFAGRNLLLFIVSLSLASCEGMSGAAPEGCEFNGSPRKDCTTEWVKDKKGDLLVIKWADGDKTTIRPLQSAYVLINEKSPGKLIDNSSFIKFENLNSGTKISVSPALTDGVWGKNKINLSKLLQEQKEEDEGNQLAQEKRRKELEEIERKKAQEEQKQREELAARQKIEDFYRNPIERLTVKQLADEFEANSIVAEDKYANQLISVTGVIDSVDDSWGDQNNVTVKLGVPDGIQCFGELGCMSTPDFSFASISCAHKRSDPVLKELRKGMRLEVRGVVYGESTGVRLKNCRYYKI